MKMKKIWKKILCITLALTMLLTAVPVWAEENPIYVPQDGMCTLYPSNSEPQEVSITSAPSKFSSLKSSNTSIGTVKQGKEPWGYTIYFYPKKVGKATISFKYKTKTYKVPMTVLKYKNPISSVTIGNTKISGSKFNSRDTYNLKYSKFANKKVKVNIKMKSGWELSEQYSWNGSEVVSYPGFQYALKGWAKTEPAKNGSSITIKGGKGASIMIDAVNKSTKQIISITLNFK